MSAFELKQGDDFIVAIDVSGSMDTRDCPGGMSRFAYAMEKTKQFCKEADKIDADGISIITFGANVRSYENVTNAKVEEILADASPIQAATFTDQAIRTAWNEHIKNGNDRSLVLIVTDGEPTCEKDVFSIIADITQTMKSPDDFRLCFLTVGTPNAGLTKFLKKLDDDVPGAKYDIVKVLDLATVEFYAAMQQALAG
jgi:uncharacterized protein YegL